MPTPSLGTPLDHFKHAVDGVSIAAVVATLAGWMPGVAAFASLIWTLIRIYETKTIQRLLHGEGE